MKIFFLVCLCVFGISGCGEKIPKPDSEYSDIGNGFGYILKSAETYPAHTALYGGIVYKDSKGTNVQVWPHFELVNNDSLVHSNVILLIGGKYDSGHEQRLIAFEAPSGPAMDITRQIYADYCAKTSVKMTNIIQNSFAGVFQTNDSVRIEFSIIKIGLRGEGSVDSDDGTEIISWNDISKIVAEVRKDGKRKKEQKSGFEYLQKE